MKLIFINLLLVFNVTISSNSAESLNIFFKNDLSFIQTSLNTINNNFDTSSGNIYRDKDNSIKIEVYEPFKETYSIDNQGIKIHDLEFDQVRIINKEDINNNILEFLYNGFSEEKLNIENFKNSDFKIVDNESSYYFKFIDQNTLQIKYKDNMGIENLIKFFKK